MAKIKVLVACEFSGTVRNAFRNKGHDAWSCDLIPCLDGSEYHIQDDVLNHLNGWDLIIGHPPCTYLTVTANRWLSDPRYPTRVRDREEAAEFFMKLYSAPANHICLENPVGYMSTYYRKPDQIIQPYQFGHPEQKRTCLWFKDLPKLVHTNIVEQAPRVNKLPAWYNKGKGRKRSITFKGIAEAMADQWGNYLNEKIKEVSKETTVSPLLAQL